MGLALAPLTLARGDVYLVALDPRPGSEIQKTRPCVVVSPDELNRHLRTAIIAPMTTGGHAYAWRISCRFRRRTGFVVLDQLRTVDRDRCIRKLGRITPATLTKVLAALQEMFAT